MNRREPTPAPPAATGSPVASGGACHWSGSPFTAEELALLDRFRALREERRRLAAEMRAGASPDGSGAGTDGGEAQQAREARIREINDELERLHLRGAGAWRRRMIALGHLDPDDTPLVSLDELRRRG